MTLKIVRTEVRAVAVPGPARREVACLALREASGLTGVGEAAPIPGFSRETLDASRAALLAVAAGLDEIDPDAPPAAEVARVLISHSRILDEAPSARFALETALLDLIAQGRGADLASCVRGGRRERGSSDERALLGRERDCIEVSALLREPADPAFVERVRAATRRGFRVLKVKLRADDDEALGPEIEGLRALRRAAPEVELRLDPNGRWSIDDARRRLDRLAQVEPAFVEQPVAPADLLRLGPCAVPWAADESLGIAGAAEELSAESGCAAFVIKPAALGVLRSRALADIARSRGLAVVITHFFDGPIGLAAACETALSLDADVRLLACGLDPHEGLSGLPRAALPHHARPARVQAIAGIGLGLSQGMQEALSSWTP